MSRCLDRSLVAGRGGGGVTAEERVPGGAAVPVCAGI